MLRSLLIILLFAGCKAAKPVTKTVVTDSTATTTVYVKKDSLIYLPAQSITLVDTLPCPGEKKGSAKAGAIKAGYRLKNGKLTINCETDSLATRISWLEKELSLWRSHTEYKEVPVTVKVPTPHLPKWIIWVLALSLGFNIWYNRRPLITIVKHLITKW